MLAVCFAFACSAIPAQVVPKSSQEPLLEMTRALLKDLKSVKALLLTGVAQRDLPVVNSITFQVPDGYTSDFYNCFAGKDANGNRVVWIGLGLTRALRMFIDNLLIAEVTHDPHRANDYIDYVRGKWRENLSRAKDGLAPVFIESPYTYSPTTIEVLHKISGMSDSLYSGVLSFAVAHEIGHHILDHDVLGSEHSEKNEEEADSWAMLTLLAAGQPPTVGLVLVGFSDAFLEEGPSHPSNGHRAIAMIRATLANLDRFADIASSKGVSIESLRKQLTDTLAGLQSDGFN